MAGKTVYDVLIEKCDEAIQSHTEFLVGGGAKEFPEYREVTGVIRGLTLAKREILDLLRNQMKEDDDD